MSRAKKFLVRGHAAGLAHGLACVAAFALVAVAGCVPDRSLDGLPFAFDPNEYPEDPSTTGAIDDDDAGDDDAGDDDDGDDDDATDGDTGETGETGDTGDEGGVASGVIGADGGRLSVAGFTLTVGAGALAGDTALTLTVGEVEGLTFELPATVTAVSLRAVVGPAGVTFGGATTLRVATPGRGEGAVNVLAADETAEAGYAVIEPTSDDTGSLVIEVAGSGEFVAVEAVESGETSDTGETDDTGEE